MIEVRIGRHELLDGVLELYERRMARLLIKRGVIFRPDSSFTPTAEDMVPPWRYWCDSATGDLIVQQGS